MTLPPFRYHAPATVAQAVALRQRYGEDAMVVAGGLSVVYMLRERLARPAALISLSEIPELCEIRAGAMLRVGAMVTHAQAAHSEDVRRAAALLAQACSHVGSPAIRNMGTLGGSVSQADNASDVSPALLALDAQVRIAGAAGERSLPIAEFFVGALSNALARDEIAVALEVPPLKPDTLTRYMKYTATSAEAFSTVTVALCLVRNSRGECVHARIGLGSVAPIPARARAAESLLLGKALTPEAIEAAAEAAAGGTDPPSGGHASAAYRRRMTAVWVRRLLADAAMPQHAHGASQAR